MTAITAVLLNKRRYTLEARLMKQFFVN